MNCPEFSELMKYLDGELPRGRISELEGHLQRCPACAEMVRSQRKLESAWREDFRYPSDESFRACEARIGARLVKKSRWRTVLPVAAAFVAVLLGVKLILLDGPAPGAMQEPRATDAGEYVPSSGGDGYEVTEETMAECPEELPEEFPMTTVSMESESSLDRGAELADLPGGSVDTFYDLEGAPGFGITGDEETSADGDEFQAEYATGSVGLGGSAAGGTSHSAPEPPDASLPGADDLLAGEGLTAGGTAGLTGSEATPMAGAEVSGAGGGGAVTTTGFGYVASDETIDLSMDDGTVAAQQEDTTYSRSLADEVPGDQEVYSEGVEQAIEALEESEEEETDAYRLSTDTLSANRDLGSDLQCAWCEVVSDVSTCAVAPEDSITMVTLVFDEEGMPDSLTCALLDSLLSGWNVYIPSAFRDTVLIVPASEVLNLMTSEASGVPAQL